MPLALHSCSPRCTAWWKHTSCEGARKELLSNLEQRQTTSHESTVPDRNCCVSSGKAENSLVLLRFRFLDRYFDRLDVELIQMDTGSQYITISAERLDWGLRLELLDEFFVSGAANKWLIYLFAKSFTECKIKFSLARFTYLTLVVEITPASVDKLVIFVVVHIKSRRCGVECFSIAFSSL